MPANNAVTFLNCGEVRQAPILSGLIMPSAVPPYQLASFIAGATELARLCCDLGYDGLVNIDGIVTTSGARHHQRVQRPDRRLLAHPSHPGVGGRAALRRPAGHRVAQPHSQRCRSTRCSASSISASWRSTARRPRHHRDRRGCGRQRSPRISVDRAVARGGDASGGGVRSAARRGLPIRRARPASSIWRESCLTCRRSGGRSRSRPARRRRQGRRTSPE